MTENLLHKLEEKMLMMLSEVDSLRNELRQLTQENTTLKTEREASTRKLQDLISLLDTLHSSDSMTDHLALSVAKPVLVQVDG